MQVELLNANGNVHFTSGSIRDPSVQSEQQQQQQHQQQQQQQQRNFAIMSDQLGMKGLPDEIQPPFLAYSPTAMVESGSLIYVNFARIVDFEKLKDLGIIIQDRILVARNGKIHQVETLETFL